jgi:hypothetical protein
MKIPVVAGHRGGVEVGVDASVVHKDRRRSVRPGAGLGHGRNVRLGADIGGHEPGVAADLLLDRFAEIKIEIAEHNSCAVRDEHLDDRFADAACAPGDDRDFAVE